MATEQQFVTLGSGDLYIVSYSGTMPTEEAFETEENRIGSIKSGAELSYSPETYEVTDSKGIVLKRFITKEEVVFKSGLLTWNLDVLSKLCMGGQVTKTAEKSILKIGGQRRGIKKITLKFVHTMDDGKTIKMTMVGTPTAGFTLAFNSDEETVIDAEFTAMAQDAEGTLVLIEKEI